MPGLEEGGGGIGRDYGGADYVLGAGEFFRIWDLTNTHFYIPVTGNAQLKAVAGNLTIGTITSGSVILDPVAGSMVLPGTTRVVSLGSGAKEFLDIFYAGTLTGSGLANANQITLTDGAAMVSASAISITYDAHTSGTLINLTASGTTIGNAVMKLASLTGVVTLNDVGARLEGLEIDLSGVTLTSYTFYYGLIIQMRPTYGAGTNAAIYATGNGNTLYLLSAAGIALTMASNTDAVVIRDTTGMTSATGIDIHFDEHAAGNFLNFIWDTTTLTADTTLAFMQCASSHDGVGADNLRGLYVYWTGNMPQGTANSDLTLLFTQFNGTVGSGGAQGGNIYGSLYSFGGTLNGSAINCHGSIIDMSGATYTSYNRAWGLTIYMPAAYGAGSNAAIYATGGGNIFSALSGHGIYLKMREVKSYAIYIDSDSPNDVSNECYGINISKDLTLTGAVNKTNENIMIHLRIANNRGAGGGNIDDDAMFIAMSTTSTVGSELISGNKVGMSLSGTVGAATLNGYQYYSIVTLNDAAASQNSINIDVSGVTLTSYLTNYGVKIAMPASAADKNASIFLTGNARLIASDTGLFLKTLRPTAGSGDDITITAAAGNGGASNGGSIVLTAGAKAGAGADGIVNIAAGVLSVGGAAFCNQSREITVTKITFA